MDSGRDLIRYSVTGVLLVLLAVVLDLVSMVGLSPPSVLSSMGRADLSSVVALLTFIAIPAGFLVYQLHLAYQATTRRHLYVGFNRAQGILQQLALDQSTQLVQRMAWAQEFIERVDHQAGRTPEFPFVVNASRRLPYVYRVSRLGEYKESLARRRVAVSKRVSFRKARDELKKSAEVNEGIVRWMLGSLSKDAANGEFVRQEWGKLDGRYKALGAMRVAILASGAAYALIQVTPRYRHRWDFEDTAVLTSLVFTAFVGIVLLAFQLNRVRAARDLERHVYHHLRNQFGGGISEEAGTTVGLRDTERIQQLKSEIQDDDGSLVWSQLKDSISVSAQAIALSGWDPMSDTESDPKDFEQQTYKDERTYAPWMPKVIKWLVIGLFTIVPTVGFFTLNVALREIYDDDAPAYARTPLPAGTVLEPGRPLYSAVVDVHEDYYMREDLRSVRSLQGNELLRPVGTYRLEYGDVTVTRDIRPGEPLAAQDLVIQRRLVDDVGPIVDGRFGGRFVAERILLPSTGDTPLRIGQCISLTAIGRSGQPVRILDQGVVSGIEWLTTARDGTPFSSIEVVVRPSRYSVDVRLDEEAPQMLARTADPTPSSCNPTGLTNRGAPASEVGLKRV